MVASAPISEEELLNYCADKLAGFKKPKVVVFLDSTLQKTILGKIVKRKLREDLTKK